MSSWSRLIRFVDSNGREAFGEPCVANDHELAAKLKANELWAIELQGNGPIGNLTKGDKVAVKALKPVLQQSDVPIIRCIGLNYMKHSMLATSRAIESLLIVYSSRRRKEATTIPIRLCQALHLHRRI